MEGTYWSALLGAVAEHNSAVLARRDGRHEDEDEAREMARREVDTMGWLGREDGYRSISITD